MLTTVQDLGRWGHQASGVPVAGPMDAYSHRLANRLLGNSEDAAALEITLLGPTLEAAGEIACAVAGAEFNMEVGGQPVSPNGMFVVASGAVLRFGHRRSGARATLAVRGGFDVPAVFGSRATSLVSGIGPLGGRPLAAGDVLRINAVNPGNTGNAGNPVNDGNAVNAGLIPRPLRMPAGGARLRVIAGPHEDMFTAGAIETFYSARYTVTPNSNRMGYRLEGAPLRHAATADILSDATPIGSIQVPNSGQPIVLMADRQTTGGYPKIATVISADVPIAGQLAPGDWIEFVSSTRAGALEALKEQERQLLGWSL
jgi:antagonist of KipI